MSLSEVLVLIKCHPQLHFLKKQWNLLCGNLLTCGATFIYLIYAMQLFHILEDARGVKWKHTKTNSLNNHMLNPNVAFLHSYIIFPLNILCAFI